MKKIILLLILFITAACAAEKPAVTKTTWIDVRTVAEWDSGHLKEAIHIPYKTIAKEIERVTKDKNAPIKVYCKVGGRAGIAKKTLESMGYKNVTNAGGYQQIMKERQKAGK